MSFDDAILSKDLYMYILLLVSFEKMKGINLTYILHSLSSGYSYILIDHVHCSVKFD
jgi:hypothetical protein